MTSEQIVDLYLCSAISKLRKGDFDTLNELERTSFRVIAADGEVRNGGMHAICYNSIGDHLSEIIASMKAIGAPEKAKLFEELKVVFGPEGPSTDWDERTKEHEKLSEADAEVIDALDEPYYATPNNVWQLLGEYLLARQNH